MDFLEEFQKMIDEYNDGAINVQVLFDKLLAFAKRLDSEEKRGIAEQLTEEELVIFDLLTKPDISLTKQETAGVKKVAKSLLEKLKQEKTRTRLAEAADDQGRWYSRQYRTFSMNFRELTRQNCTGRSAMSFISTSTNRTGARGRAFIR